jgi:two-component system nitrogen regulation response regulator GlnG
MLPGNILVADDDAAIRTVLNQALSRAGYEVRLTGNAATLWRWVSQGDGDLVITDVVMPDENAFDLLPRIKKLRPELPVIVMSAQNTFMTAIRASERGAYEYLPKPFDLKELIAIVGRALAEPKERPRAAAKPEEFDSIPLVGRSPAMQEIYRVLARLMQTDLTVMISGESGTGKELVARAVHSKSDRAKGPFFALNCAALPKEILENELFGHEKGAFTGSTNEKQGAFELADGGTIFLDEIAEMSSDVQVKLLRALESRQVRRLGGKREIDVDIRVVAATNKNLEKALADGEMREDLYYRLAVVELALPPLRDRMDDVQLLASEFLERYASQNGKQITGFHDDAWQWILTYHWPGNVRELKNTVERGVIMARSDKIQLSDLMPRHLKHSTEVPSTVTIAVGSSMQDAQRQLVLRTFANANGDVVRAGTVLGMPPDDVRRELLALLNSSTRTPGVEDNGRALRRTPPASAAATEAPTKAKPFKKK